MLGNYFRGIKIVETVGRNITEFIHTNEYNSFKHHDFVLWLRKNTYTKQYIKNKNGSNHNVMISVERLSGSFSQNELTLTILDIKKTIYNREATTIST